MVVNFRTKRAKPLLVKFPRLKKIHLGNIKISFADKTLKLLIKPSKKVISKDFRNAMFYWKQMAIEGRTNIFRMGELGKKLAKALPSSKIVSKKRRMEFTLPTDPETLGWALYQLSRIYKPIYTVESTQPRDENAKQ